MSIRKVLEVGENSKYGPIVEKMFEGNLELLPFYVHHLPDTPQLRLNQFVYVNEGCPWDIEAWCTQSPEKGVPGVWDGPRKLRTMKMVEDSVYPEFVLLETNWETDNTFGVVGPLVCVLNNLETFVAVNEHTKRRFAGPDGLIETKRHRHGSTDVLPQQVIDGSSKAVREYNENDLGYLLTNSACIHGQKPNGDFCLALIRGELTVVTGVDQLPVLNTPFTWIPVRDYLFLTLDTNGQNIVMRAIIAGYLPALECESMEPVLDKLPALVTKLTM
jgi:hypothetical protein